MTVRSILDEKGRDVMTLSPDATLAEASRLLVERRIGAIVICDDRRAIKGILSERDIVRAVAEQGGECLAGSVARYMTVKVEVCTENHTIQEVMEIMTNQRFRHLPVEANGRLVGIVSIGDVVKRRIDDAEREAEEIKTYIATGGERSLDKNRL